MKELIRLHINDEWVEVAAPPHWTLLEVLRYTVGLTGTKQGCDKGDCGACTVLVNDQPTLSCCALAAQYQDHRIETIEGLGTPSGPSVLQRAFDVCGALQCGFCQPGMLMSATALLRDSPNPSRQEIKEALAGNLCRCTGYTKIYEAVERAANGIEGQQPMTHSPPATGFGVIGARGRKHDSIGKAMGTTQYTDDIQLPRMAFGKILRSPHAHARIRSIQTAKAEALEGVFAVMIGADLKAPYCVIPWTPDETALAIDKVRYIGEGVAAVCAIDEDTAQKACALIEIEYEPLVPIFNPHDGLQEGCSLVHEQDWKGRQRETNLCKEVSLSFGDTASAFEHAAAVIEGTWKYAGNTHAAIEPHCAIATWSPDEQLHVYSSTQVGHYLHRSLAAVLGIPEAQVRVTQPAVGGAFGGKSEPFDLEFCTAVLAKKSGRPVKILYTREEVFYAHRGRHPMDFNFRIAADAQGTITAVDNDIVIDGGAYHSFGLVTTYYAGQLLAGPIHFGSYKYRSRRVYTNKPCCGPKRGHGSVQPRFPLETAIDELAEKLNMDPIEIRRRNAVHSGDQTINGFIIPSCGIEECLSAVETASEWKTRHGQLSQGRGLGVATSMYISGTAYPIYPNDMPQSAVQLRGDRSGKITVFTGTNDIGQGSDGVLAYIIAEETGVPVAHITVVSGDTELTPVDLGSYSSRVTVMAGIAARAAAKKLRERMVESVADHWQVAPHQIEVRPNVYAHYGETKRTMTAKEALILAESKTGTLGATGGYDTVPYGADYKGGTIGASPTYSATAHVADVSVDESTGVITVHRIWAAHDCGRALNPVMVEGQIEGSVYMGASEALFEDMEYKDSGLHRGPNLLDYRIMTTLDTPEIDSLIVESIDPIGPYGAKEAGEGPLHPAIPAIANAVYDAVGIRLREMPFTPERVLSLLHARTNASNTEPS